MPSARRICNIKAQSTVSRTKRVKLSHSTAGSRAGQPAGQRRPRAGHSAGPRLQISASCPRVGTVESLKRQSARQYSSLSALHRTSIVPHGEVLRRGYSSCNVGCPCPFPCGPCGCKGGCGCLPPPCNTPPKCLQYMTGYYYYPYGTWFCGPYHVSGTCTPVGANCPCPCPCPPKLCPACVCQGQNMSPGKNVSDTSSFPMEVPCHTAPKMPQESRTGFSKMFSNSPADKNHPSKPKPTSMPPCMTTMVTPNPIARSNITLVDKEPRINSSYPIHNHSNNSQKSRSYHTKNSITADKASPFYTQKNLKYTYYQRRHEASSPTAKARTFFKENIRRNSPRTKLDSTSGKKRRDARPDMDIEIKPYEEINNNHGKNYG